VRVNEAMQQTTTVREGDALTVGLAQINNSFSGQNYLPYAIGLLQAYAERHAEHPERLRFLLPVYKRIRVDAAVAQLEGADVVGFSLYVWNERLTLEVARRLKAARPDMLVIFGGPQVPDRAEAFLRANPFVDIACHGEGERTFLELIERVRTRDFSGVQGTSHIDRDGRFVHQPRLERLRDVATVPSPYLEGVFKPLMAAHPEEVWIALWETNRGCPFACTFCDWGSATQSKVFQFDMPRLKRELDWFSRHKIEFIFCCDANFGILPRDIEIAQAAAENKRVFGYPKALSVQNTKNATERAYLTQKILSDAGLSKGVALALQSVDLHTLEAIKRQNISLATYEELQKRFTRDRVATYSDLILGLPGESYDSFADGVARVIEGGQHNRIQFNNLSILPNAEMGDPAYQAKYGMVLVDTKIINVHGSLEEDVDGIAEMQRMVVATAAMPAADWRRARVLAWTTALLHFDKLIQIPLVVAHEVSGIGYRALIEAFVAADPRRYPLIAEIRAFFEREAATIQAGGPELHYSAEFLGIWWPADEFMFIKLTHEKKIEAFFTEARARLLDLWREHGTPAAFAPVDDAFALNRALLSQPFVFDDVELTLGHDIWRFFRGILQGEPAPLRAKRSTYRIERSKEAYADFATWCREVVWYGHRRGAYYHSGRMVEVESETELAGHY
jgi:radical SAM superfamily enzyme YgiQ (UPF0313 family)